jgi:glycosyltransferase involved in cell wall biosynthesis
MTEPGAPVPSDLVQPDPWPAVSVVVPVRNAAARIGPCIEALLGQDYPGPAPELLAVDNGSTDRTAAVLGGFAGRIVRLDEPRRGAAAARNAGIRRASRDWIAFTDADCVPRPGWLRGLLAAAGREPRAALVGGRILALEPTNDIGRFAASLFDQRQAIEADHPPYVISANLLARRADLLRFGLFDPAYLRGQDAELAWRAHFRHGAAFAYAPEAVVEHANVSCLGGLWRKGLQHGRGSARLWRDYRAELGRSPWGRVRRTGPYRDALVETLALLGGPRGDPPDRAAFYGAVFRLARHLAFCRGTLIPED